MIRTKLHILAQNLDPRDMTPGKDNAVVKAMLAAASYVVDKEVLDILKREDTARSVKALVEADLVRLPYNPMVVEFEIDKRWHEFVALREHNGSIYGRIATMENESCAAMVANQELRLDIVDGAFKFAPVLGANNTETKIFVNAFLVAVNLALLMLNTKGIEKEVVTVSEALNKKRRAKGKPAIPHHSVVHIGTIYRRDGTAIKREGGGGWNMPMHWRCGYTRKQHFGKNREEEKMVYIPPCIVNFKPEEDAPEAPKRKIKI